MTDPITIVAGIAIATAIALYAAFNRVSRERRELRDKLENFRLLHERKLQLVFNERDGLLDALSDVFIIIDESHSISYANSAAHRLLQSRKLTDRHVREVFTDPRLRKAIDECLAARGPHQLQLTLPLHNTHADDTEGRTLQTWEIDSTPMVTAEGVSPATRVVMRDVTLQHQTEQIRKDFVANASHELRTPMSIIHGYLENLLDDDLLEDPEMSRKFLGIMRKHSDRMTRIIEDMLVISRLESGEEGSLRIEPFKLSDCLQDILERLESLIRAQQVEVELDLDPADLELRGDRFYWTQALFNLIENAIKQNPRPGLEIRIGCCVEGDQAQIWVVDKGIGIPSADLPYIFRRFYRVDKQHHNSEIKGTGLGLSIVKRAIEAHQGSIEASSTPGIETRFLIRVPLAGPQGPELAVEPGPTETETG